MANTVGGKGQVVIEKPIREALGLEPGFVAVQTLIADHVEIRFFPPEHDRSLHGALAPYVRRPVSDDELREARAEAWTADAAESETESRRGPRRFPSDGLTVLGYEP